jgi:hypothetical protein
MPVKRTQLSRQQRAIYLARAQDLRAAGLECQIPDELQEHSRSIDIFAASPEGNMLCELPSGVTAYAIWVHLVALVGNLILDSVRIVSEWDSESIVLWRNQRGLYCVGSAFEFTEKDVLNHRIEDGLPFRRGDIAEGWLVASGLRPIPEGFQNRMLTKLSITFTDQFAHEHTVQAHAVLERSARFRNSASRVGKSSGLFEVDPASAITFVKLPRTEQKATFPNSQAKRARVEIGSDV